MRIFLASASPRRKMLLGAHFRLHILKPDVDERQKSKELPLTYVRRMALIKWQKGQDLLKKSGREKAQKDQLLVSADTVVILGKKIFGKPKDKNEARRMLKALSQKTHQVVTAVAIGRACSAKPEFHFPISTKVRFSTLSPLILEKYLLSNEWKDKAGAYAIQGRAGAFVAELHGSLTNVVGLPVSECYRALVKMGAQPHC